MPVTPGRSFGPYEIGPLLGSGGMGAVYRARDSRLKRDVALKVLKLDSPDARVRFEREAHTVAALNHPNIVTIYSVEEVDGVPFLTMELVQGHALHGLIPQGGLPRERVLEFATQMAEAVVAAHRKGIIHRDLKPSNVMITGDGHIKVLDFGLAKALPSATHTADDETKDATRAGIALGTMSYMSPEQARGEPLDERSDIFSLGLVIFEMATGRRPFAGPTDVAALAALLERPAPAIGEPFGDLDGVLARALAKHPQTRYSRADELLYDLKSLKAGSGSTMTRPVARPAGPSVAVLPFVNMTADPDQEYFCDGMAEELISALSRIKGLAVAARTSSFQFKGQALDIRQIGERLRVQTVLEGSVRKLGNRLRIGAQLVNTSDGYQLWSERYDRTLDDVFAIQDDIASSIARSLEVALGRSPASHIVKPLTENLEAYHLYLRGRYLSYQLANVAESLMGALECFTRATALDATFAAAHAGIADANIMLGYYTILPSSQAASQALAAAERAVALDPAMPEGYSALGWVKTCYGIDMATAEADLRRAIDLGPSHVPARCYLGVFLFAVGRFDESVAMLQECLARDPSFLVARFSLCHAYVAGRRFDEAMREMTFLQELADIPGTRWYQALALGGRGAYDEAVAVAEEGAAMAQGAPLFVGQLALMHALAGHRHQAEALLTQLTDAGHASAYLLALVHGALGRLDEGFVLLNRAIDDHNDNVSLMAVDWRFDPFRRDPRFRAALTRLHLPDLATHV